MKLSIQVSAFLVAVLATLNQSAIATTNSQSPSRNLTKSSIAITKTTLARQNKLPKVGFVRSSERGQGCYYSLVQDRGKKRYIFVNASGTLMNFDGQDTNLVMIGSKSTKSVEITDYTANDLRIRVTTMSSNNQDYLLRGTITIKSGDKSKVIKFEGEC
jgi:hypothetical protein